MPKNFAVESIRHHMLRALEKVQQTAPVEERLHWGEVSQTFDVIREADRSLTVTWVRPRRGRIVINRNKFVFYQRGDLPDRLPGSDPAHANAAAADAVVAEIGTFLGLSGWQVNSDRFHREEAFHEEWASCVHPEEVMVRESFEACTAPENRFILGLLGDLQGKRLLDLGSGLGEASVYFAMKGAQVTACDLSRGMLDVTSRVAARHGVKVALHCAAAEKTGLPDCCFDVVYAGNLLHHVDVAAGLDEARRVLVPGGLFVSWDPLAHNPLINVYRRMANAVRTSDEHPLRIRDLELFAARFKDVQWRCFWLFTLAVFLRFYLWEKIHPSQERYWKKILTDAPRLSSFYRRLEACDNCVLSAAPWLARYCWNIVVWGTK